MDIDFSIDALAHVYGQAYGAARGERGCGVEEACKEAEKVARHFMATVREIVEEETA